MQAHMPGLMQFREPITISSINKKTLFLQETSWYYPVCLDVDKMNEACIALLGEHDFTSFSRLHTDVKTNTCVVHDARWISEDSRLTFVIRANRFLRNMVRAIVGTMVLVGKGRITIEDFMQIMALRDRALAGASAPSEGLFLMDVEYPGEVFKPLCGRSIRKPPPGEPGT